MSRLAAVLAGVALLVSAGCGDGGPNAQDVLKQTAANIGKIRSGTLGVHFLVTPHGGGAPFGFDLTGPFTFRTGKLPLARLVYTQIANGQRASATLVSTPTAAYIDAGGAKRPLSADEEQALRRATAQIAGAGGIGSIVVGDWLTHTKASSDGNGTDKVTAELDVAKAADGLLSAARLAGQNVHELTQADEKRLEDAVRSSSFVLYSGAKDRLLRELDMSIDFAFDVPRDLRAALGSLAGAKVDFRLKVNRPNQPVKIAG